MKKLMGNALYYATENKMVTSEKKHLKKAETLIQKLNKLIENLNIEIDNSHLKFEKNPMREISNSEHRKKEKLEQEFDKIINQLNDLTYKKFVY